MHVSYNQDPEICPLYRGAHYRGVSIKRGFTVYGHEILPSSILAMLMAVLQSTVAY